jgi:hypothetical protein
MGLMHDVAVRQNEAVRREKKTRPMAVRTQRTLRLGVGRSERRTIDFNADDRGIYFFNSMNNCLGVRI